MPWWPGHTLCPWHLIFTHDGLRVQRTISLRYKDTSTCCFVKFISAASSLLPFSLEALLRERAREWGANIFCRDSFNPVLRMLLVAAPWVSLGHCSWKREAGGWCQLQLSARVWMNNKEIYKTSWNKGPGSLLATLSPFPHWLDHTSYITSWSGLPCQWRQSVRMLFSKMEKRFRQLAWFIAATAVILVNLKQFELSKQHRNIAFDEFQRNDLSTKVENKWEKS